MSTEAIIGMIVCLTITVGGFLVFLFKALTMDKKKEE
ncbi:MetS family NSS transporter small subunit [Marivirga arenosa]|uniref:MetS family NSS transporter small subunit n=1 Tax=Marivirga arenosa TaxID=3059076 RepID=A0AA51ZVX8_9BACT|nr:MULTISPECIES: MetS family NSS transporter small subunit [unclassified Marivirga]WMN05903.1 MetS family NSS transporter small subunit [Marivirga sp. ABR2-2]WNB17717.1 MetS family NSS transporter small subunit [Marivirga sp. BKB1-2]